MIIARLDFIAKSSDIFYDVVERLVTNNIQFADWTGKISTHLLEQGIMSHRYDQSMVRENESEDSDDSWSDENNI